MQTPITSIIMVLCACLVGSFGPILLKKATKKLKLNIKSVITNRELIFGVLLYGVATIIFIPALKHGELSVLYPFVATTYVWVCLFSMKFLKERMNVWKWLGIISIIIGVSFIGLGS